jgi:translation initiation factor 1 (eIF-1/SUI1)
MFFEYYYPNKKDAILIHIQDKEDNGLLVTYINGFKSKYIITKHEAYRLKNILENK